MKWITQERTKRERIACPWLNRNFAGPKAEVLFVTDDKLVELAKKESAAGILGDQLG